MGAAKTLPKGKPTPKQATVLNLPSTIRRRYHGQDHFQPRRTGWWDADGRLWHGHSRVTNKAARRKRNRLTWQREVKLRRAAERLERQAMVAAELVDTGVPEEMAKGIASGKRLILNTSGRGPARWA